MRTILRRMQAKFLGRHLPLRVRLFNMMGFAGIVIALISSIVSILNGEPLVSTLANLITAPIAFALIYYASRSGRYQICYMITIIILFLIMFPVIFFLAGAYSGAMPYFFVFAVVFTVFMLEDRKALLFVLLELFVYIAICIHAYNYPRAIFIFASEAARLRDIIIGFTICSIALGITLYLHFREFLEQQRQLEKAREDAVLASQAKSNFLANMSHEIRTPINVILGMNEMVLRDSMSDSISTYGMSIQNAGKTLLNIINDILDVAKIETGKMELMEEQYRTADLIADLVMTGLELGNRKGLRFSVHADENLPAELVGDFLHVKQIVANFISNAVKYTERGSVALSVYQEPVPSSRGRDILLGLSVADTGIGIKEENLNALFETFVQVNVHLHRHAEGAGLGLAIAKELTEHMGGRIYVKSSFGEGSVFTVEIPQGIGAAEPMGPLSLSGNKPPRPREKGFIAPQGSILVVDDHEENLQVIKALLSRTMLRVDAAASGHECLELVKTNHYHVIFIDYMMPGLDGVATRRRLQEKIEGFSVPTVAFTANVIAGVRQMLLDAGFDAYMSKPVMWNDLKKMLLHYLPAEIVLWGENESVLPDAENLIEEMKQELADYDIELDKGLHYVDGNLSQYLTIAKIFTDNYASEIDKIARLAGAGDIKRLSYEIHSLKSKALSLGAVHLHNLAAELEKRCRAEDADYIKTALPLLFFACQRSKTGLERFNSPEGEQALAAGDHEKGSTAALLEYICACRRKEARQELDRIATAGGIDGIDLNAVRHAIEELDFEEAEQLMLV